MTPQRVWSLRAAFMVLAALPVCSPATRAQVDQPGTIPYRERCANCHGLDPAQLAARLQQVDDHLVIKRSGQPLELFLTAHAAANEDQRNQITALMARLVKPPQ